MTRSVVAAGSFVTRNLRAAKALMEAAVPMAGESFQRRVEMLRESWLERRQMKDFASVHDFESQLALLRTLHGWAGAAIEDIQSVYGDALPARVTAEPVASPTPAFSVAISNQYTVTFSLLERRRAESSRWFISVAVNSGGPGGAIVAAGPERRTGQWTRARLEDILLSVLGAYERSVSEHARPGSPSLRARGA